MEAGAMKNTENPVMPQDEKVVVYETPDGEMRVDVRLDQETVWLTQRLAERGLREARETLDLLDRTLRNQALVDNAAFSGPGRSVSIRSMRWNWLGGWWNNVTSLLGDVNLKPQSSASSNSPNAVPVS